MNFLAKTQRFIMFISSILIIIGLSLAVLLRYVLKIDLFGLEELLIIPIFFLYFFGAAYGSYENSHITADIMDTYVKNQTILKWLRIFTTFVSLAASSVFSFWAFQYFLWSVNKLEKTPGWHIPLFIPHGIVLIGFLLMSFYFLVHLIQKLRGMKVEGV